ncbi:MAG: NifB/NifX family molybdenum-iron cluster-binding protein [Candidatus Hadarchaeales archaeon]
MGGIKVAIATKGFKGLGDEVADAFALAKTFTITTIKGKRVHLEVVQNPAAFLPHGRGRAVAELLKDKGVNVVVASEFGPGASALLEQQKIKRVLAPAGTLVSNVIREEIYKRPT